MCVCANQPAGPHAVTFTVLPSLGGGDGGGG